MTFIVGASLVGAPKSGFVMRVMRVLGTHKGSPYSRFFDSGQKTVRALNVK